MSLAKKTQVTLTLDGEQYSFEMQPEVETILQAGLDQDINLPYSCMGGACSTCCAKLIAGEVEMDCNLVLSDQEVAQNYILTCQSRPTTAKVSIDYDDNNN